MSETQRWLSDEERLIRFWQYVDRSGGDDACWPWTGGTNGNGRGRFQWKRGRGTSAYRMAALVAGMDLSDGAIVCHRCDNPSCVNPAHLFVGTQRDNIHDARAKGRLWSQKKTHCLRGHEFTPENTSIPSNRPYRNCLKCRRLYRKRGKA